jgi:hypothetical protein
MKKDNDGRFMAQVTFVLVVLHVMTLFLGVM